MTSNLESSALLGEKGAASEMICLIVVFSDIEALYSLDLLGDTTFCFSALPSLLGLDLYFGEF